jgi:hypothetical protein
MVRSLQYREIEEILRGSKEITCKLALIGRRPTEGGTRQSRKRAMSLRSELNKFNKLNKLNKLLNNYTSFGKLNIFRFIEI